MKQNSQKFFISLIIAASVIPQNIIAQDLKNEKSVQSQNIIKTSADANYKFLQSNNPLQDRIFYLATLLEKNPNFNNAILNNKIIKKIGSDRLEKIKNNKSCGAKPLCLYDAYLWSDEDIKLVSDEIEKISINSVGKNFNSELSKSGYFIFHETSNDGKPLIVKAWEDMAHNMNHIIKIYGQGEKPLYPDIDSIAYDVASASYANLTELNDNLIKEITINNKSFFEPSLSMALNLLYINEREDAVHFDPINDPENKNAGILVKKTDFSKYKYSSILVLGSGPNNNYSALSDRGKIRLMAAVNAWNKGIAPFIIVSGGSVHPAHTKYVEAVEMKKELVSRYHIPENKIFIEPYARHTTTNFRNAVRIMFKYGIPLNKDALVVSSTDHIDYVASDKFNERNKKELGYEPVFVKDRFSPFAIAYKANILSLHINWQDPLDP